MPAVGIWLERSHDGSAKGDAGEFHYGLISATFREGLKLLFDDIAETPPIKWRVLILEKYNLPDEAVAVLR